MFVDEVVKEVYERQYDGRDLRDKKITKLEIRILLNGYDTVLNVKMKDMRGMG